MRGLMLLADGFEDTEALTTRDVLTRAGIEVTTASISDYQQVQSSFGVEILSDALLKLVFDITPYDFLVLPGGGKGTANLEASSIVHNCIDKFIKYDKYVCAICAAPSILGHRGYLKDKKFTCFAGCEKGIDGIFTGKEVEQDGKIITARSMMYSIPFGLKIIENLLGKEAAQKVEIGLKGQHRK